jgi:hypothetical protein
LDGLVSAGGFADLTRAELAVLVPELLLGGHLIDRAGLPHVLVALGPDGMRDVAIEEWQGASPVYTRRMQSALGFVGDDVVTIFKGLQLDVGAPPQFMDFRYTVHDRDHGEFHLAHCGALMDVEPMGEAYVRRMCHDIEDPTFDATAVATNPKAVMRPIHRPPRVPADRTPHCAWTVTIDEANDAPPYPPQAVVIGATEAARFAGVTAIDRAEEGLTDYAGPLFADVPFAEFSHSALVRMAEEVCLQGHLLALSYRLAVAARLGDAAAVDMMRKQFTGAAGVVAGRLRSALGLPAADVDLACLARILRVHPALNPAGYVEASVHVDGGQLLLTLGRRCAAVRDGAWPALLDGEHLEPVQALLRAVDHRLQVQLLGVDEEQLRLAVVVDEDALEGEEAGEVLVTRVSTGAAFVLAERRSLLPVVTT